MSNLKKEIRAFVDDHKQHFDCYPTEVEVNGEVYDFDTYWDILDGINRPQIKWTKAKIIPTRDGYKTEEVE